MNRNTVSGIILTLLFVNMLSMAFNIQLVRAEPKTWYVDDDGGADFTRIQDAIYAASPGDTIYVYPGLYFENLIVRKGNLTIVGESKSNTIIDGQGNVVISIYKNRVSVRGFTLLNGGQSWYIIWGSVVLLDYAQYCNISDNIVSNSRRGIASYRGRHNTISGNTISDTNQGVTLYYTLNETVTGNVISNGVQYGSDPPYGVQVFRGSNNKVVANTAANISYTGIRLTYAARNIVSGNIAYNTSVGISADYTSSFNTIVGNNAFNNEIGIGIHGHSNNNTIARNNASTNEKGIDVGDSNNNILTLNNVRDNEYGIMLSLSSKNSVTGNNMTNNHAGIYLGHSSNNSIAENNIANNNYGVMLAESSRNNIIQNSIIANNRDGIWVVLFSNNNSIAKNSITANNGHGVWLFDSSNNRIFHNNFVANTRQAFSKFTNAWDDGYPSGGNYWSDYEETYPDAEEIDNSGIWNIPYWIDENNQDNYPLIEPWTPLPRTIGELKTETEDLGSEGEIDNKGIVTSLIAKLNVAQKLVDSGKIDQAKTILEAFIQQVQNLSGIHMTVEAADILIESAEHILSHL